jgi:hypothetical protein
MIEAVFDQPSISRATKAAKKKEQLRLKLVDSLKFILLLLLWEMLLKDLVDLVDRTNWKKKRKAKFSFDY